MQPDDTAPTLADLNEAQRHLTAARDALGKGRPPLDAKESARRITGLVHGIPSHHVLAVLRCATALGWLSPADLAAREADQP